MKIVAISDLHGYLPEIYEHCDVLCICGDIVPLSIQSYPKYSIDWLNTTFKDWCYSIDCDKIIIISGNHDFVFEELYDEFCESRCDLNEIVKNFSQYVSDKLDFGEKIIYLHDNLYEYNGVTFYGTPHIPELKRWAFYQCREDLEKYYNLIPDDVDVLLTHSPGKFVNDTGVSLELPTKPEYGSIELTDAVKNKNIKYWFCGHVHSGNHELTKFNNINVANVSLKDENYLVSYKPLTIDDKKLAKK